MVQISVRPEPGAAGGLAKQLRTSYGVNAHIVPVR
jgi:hypothetical protein